METSVHRTPPDLWVVYLLDHYWHYTMRLRSRLWTITFSAWRRCI